jgi:hypothetical protein
MSMILDTPPDPKFQRLHYPLPDYKMEELHSQLLHKIEIGLASEGLKFRRRRPGLRIQHGPAVIHLWLDYYLDERWWKIMIGHGSDEPAFISSMEKFGEFNFALEEIDETTGLHIASFIQAPEHYRWHLFDHAHSYPGYAWSIEGRRTYCEYQHFLDLRRERIRQKQNLAPRKTQQEILDSVFGEASRNTTVEEAK